VLTSEYGLVVLKPSASGSELKVDGLPLIWVGEGLLKLAPLENADATAVLKSISELVIVLLRMRLLNSELNTGGSVLVSSGEGVARMGGLDDKMPVAREAVRDWLSRATD